MKATHGRQFTSARQRLCFLLFFPSARYLHSANQYQRRRLCPQNCQNSRRSNKTRVSCIRVRLRKGQPNVPKKAKMKSSKKLYGVSKVLSGVSYFHSQWRCLPPHPFFFLQQFNSGVGRLAWLESTSVAKSPAFPFFLRNSHNFEGSLGARAGSLVEPTSQWRARLGEVI